MARLTEIALICLVMLTAGCRQFNIVYTNEDCRLEISENGYAVSLKVGGKECLDKTKRVPLCEIGQDRPYDNENFLMYPAKPRRFPAKYIERDGDTLYVTFRETGDIAVVVADIQPHYMGFRLERVDYRMDNVGVKRQTEIDDLALIQLPVRRMQHFGEWLNVTWNDKRAVCLMGGDEKTRIDSYEDGKALKMYAGLESGVGMKGAGAVLVACPTSDFMDNVDRVERDFGMPRGVQSRRCPEYDWSYYELRDVTPENIDEHIYWAKKGGFRTMVVYYPDFASTCGHFLWREGWNMDVLKGICDKITDAGLIPGFHIHYSKVSVDDPYICSGHPDARLNYVAQKFLARPLGSSDTEIAVYGSPEVLRFEKGRRILRIRDEFISYTAAREEGGGIWMLTGCERGLWNTTPASYHTRESVLQPDMDDWPRFIRISQDGGLQEEIAARIAEIYNTCGFRFVYFDGAEDVPKPYWYNVSRSQKAVFDLLEPAPLFSEGALKSHYGWHILSRGNAFDMFWPDYLFEGMEKYTLRGARMNAENFTAVDFGWMNYIAPGALSSGTRPEHFEYVFSKAAEYGSPVGVMGKLDQIKASRYSEENFAIMKKWNDKQQ